MMRASKEAPTEPVKRKRVQKPKKPPVRNSASSSMAADAGQAQTSSLNAEIARKVAESFQSKPQQMILGYATKPAEPTNQKLLVP